MTSPHVSYFQPFYLEAGKRRKTSRKTFVQTSFVEHRKWQKDQSKYSNWSSSSIANERGDTLCSCLNNVVYLHDISLSNVEPFNFTVSLYLRLPKKKSKDNKNRKWKWAVATVYVFSFLLYLLVDSTVHNRYVFRLFHYCVYQPLFGLASSADLLLQRQRFCLGNFATRENIKRPFHIA